MPATFEPATLDGVVIVRPVVHPDGRGCFFETYKESEYSRNGIAGRFVQDNHSVSTGGVLRGLHFQTGEFAQGKLVRVVRGSVYDVAVDLRQGSPSFGAWFGIELSAENRVQLYIPPGFAHGFLTLTPEAEFCYKCTREYNKASERGIAWNDPAVNIAWPLNGASPAVSEKDRALPTLEQWAALEG